MLTPKQIIHSKRKSLSLIINNNAELIVRAPMKCSNKRIYEFIHKKADWIIKTKQNISQNKPKQITLSAGETLSILGEDYSVSLYDKSRIKIENGTLFLPKDKSKEKLIAYLKKILKEYILQRLAEICNDYGFSYLSISISSAKTNWGSCSFKNRLHFTYKLALCPKIVVDYVIKHELTHTRVKNHSKAFYLELEKVCPNYKQCEKWLKTNRAVIDIL